MAYPGIDVVDVDARVLGGGAPESAAELHHEAACHDLVLGADQVECSRPSSIEDDVGHGEGDRLAVEAPDLIGWRDGIDDLGVQDLITEVCATRRLFLGQDGVDKLAARELFAAPGERPEGWAGQQNRVAQDGDDVFLGVSMLRPASLLPTFYRFPYRADYIITLTGALGFEALAPTLLRASR